MSDLRRPAIEVFADIWCPFTHVGLRTFAELRRSRDSDLGIRVRPWPLELVNGVPLDPHTTGEHADDLRRQVAPTLFAHLDLAHFPNSTLEALALVERAYGMEFERGERASFRVRDALFEEGRDISDPGVLADLAAELGIETPLEVDRSAVVTSWHEGVERGVLGSPHFFCGATQVFCPTLEIERTAESGLIVKRDTSALVAFFEECLA